MEKAVIRKMVHDDLPGVIEIEKLCHPTPWQLRSFEYEIDNSDAILKVASLENKVIGYVCIRTILDETHLMNISVLPEFRSRGVGELLLCSVIDELRQLKPCAELTLEVRESNGPALRLYEKLGFKEAGRRPKYYRKPEETAVIMKKTVTGNS